MPYADLREFIKKVESEGELVRVKVEVDVKYEVGAICRLVLNREGVHHNRALFFEKPKGYSVPIIAGLLDSRPRYYLATETTKDNFAYEFFQRREKLIDPRLVKEGPCKENVMIGKDVDLSVFPIPIWNEKDGGPYITQGITIIKDPNSGIRNAGMYRLMVHDHQRLGIYAASYRQIHEFADIVFKRGETLPVAITIGHDPAVTASAIFNLPNNIDEMALAGAIRREPVDLIRCETVPLEVPATAEIVIEGEIRQGDRKDEGPFGEFTGYYGARLPQPVISINAITHRNNPIYECCYQGRPPTCNAVTKTLSDEAQIMRSVHRLGLKKIRMCVESATFVAVASIHKTYSGQEKVIAMAILGLPASTIIKMLIMVDDDIDPDNWAEVQWALGTRFQPQEDLVIVPNVTGLPLDPSIPVQEKEANAYRTSKVIIDATRPLHCRYPEECSPKPDILKEVIENWPKYGIS